MEKAGMCLLQVNAIYLEILRGLKPVHINLDIFIPQVASSAWFVTLQCNV